MQSQLSFLFLIQRYDEDNEQSADSRPSSAGSSRNKRNVTYCQQITKQQYQKEALEFSRQEIGNLLQSIVSDRSLSSKELSRVLKQVSTFLNTNEGN